MKKPNIVFILMDDMGYKDLGVYGSTFYETPVLDKLARDGMLFTDGYASCPVCSPTRASLMTGRYPASIGLTHYLPWNAPHVRDAPEDARSFEDDEMVLKMNAGKLEFVPFRKHLPTGERTIAQALSEAGYATWHVGKWHLGSRGHQPTDFGFDVNIAGGHWGLPPKGYFSPYGMDTLPDGPEGEYLTDRITDEAIRLITDRKRDQPFFLNMSHYAVHVPIQSKPEDVDRFKEKSKRLKLDQIVPFVEGEAYETEYLDWRVKRRIIQSDPAYAAMVWNLDWNTGRLLEALKESGELENTMIIFTSDNGGLATSEGSPTCNAPLAEGKGWTEEGGIREPLIIRWPGVTRPGSVCTEPVTTPDFYPTLLEAAGLPATDRPDLEGLSLLPLLREEGPLDREAIYWHYPHYSNQGGRPSSAIRSGKYKLIEWFETGRTELYDLVADISETTDLSAELQAVHDRLLQMLTEWRAKVDAKIPGLNPRWKGAN